jgi:hypothetical protein
MGGFAARKCVTVVEHVEQGEVKMELTESHRLANQVVNADPIRYTRQKQSS